MDYPSVEAAAARTMAKVIADNGLFAVPDVFGPILYHADTPGEMEDAGDEMSPAVDAWREALPAPFSQFHSYVEYISDRSSFGTQRDIY